MPELYEIQQLDETQLVAILESEEEDSVGYYRSQIAEDQETALRYYYGQPFGDEVEGRSQVVSLDVREAVEWLMPDLARIFVQGAMFEVEPDHPDAVQSAKQATEYLNHVFFRDNKGFQIWQDWAKDGLIQKIGVARIDWQDPEWLPPEEHKNLSTAQMQEILAGEEAGKMELLKHEERDCEPVPTHPDGICYDVTLRRLEPYGKPILSGAAPEEVLIKRASVTLEDSSYKAHVYYRSLGDILKEHPDKREELEGQVPADEDENLETRKQERFWDEEYRPETAETPIDWSGRLVRYLDEYIKVDYNGDGIPELRNVKRIGRLVLYNEEVA